MTFGTVGLVLLQTAPGLDPNIVKPGWTPLLILVMLLVVLTLLYFSMRRHVRRINVPERARPSSDVTTSEESPADGVASPADSTPHQSR